MPELRWVMELISLLYLIQYPLFQDYIINLITWAGLASAILLSENAAQFNWESVNHWWEFFIERRRRK